MFLIQERLLCWIFNVEEKSGKNILTRNNNKNEGN